jgi:VanZ family protein
MVLGFAVLALMPVVPGLPSGANDKLLHALGFAVLVVPMTLARPMAAPGIWFAAVAYGLLIEIVQPYTGRMSEAADLMADALGAAAGILLAWTWLALWRMRRVIRQA